VQQNNAGKWNKNLKELEKYGTSDVWGIQPGLIDADEKIIN
jgi:hypothetical protein